MVITSSDLCIINPDSGVGGFWSKLRGLGKKGRAAPNPELSVPPLRFFENLVRFPQEGVFRSGISEPSR